MTQQKWRDDGQCGKYYPLPDGTPSECDPDGESPCCNGVRCGNSQLDCYCLGCIDYSGTKKWRDDRSCGEELPLSDGKPAQCDPSRYNMCCYRKYRVGRDEYQIALTQHMRNVVITSTALII